MNLLLTQNGLKIRKGKGEGKTSSKSMVSRAFAIRNKIRLHACNNQFLLGLISVSLFENITCLHINFRCNCGNCDKGLIQNVYECQCCQEIWRCVDNIQSEDVLDHTGKPQSCVAHHSGFRITCLEKWSFRMAASKYRTISRRASVA